MDDMVDVVNEESQDFEFSRRKFLEYFAAVGVSLTLLSGCGPGTAGEKEEITIKYSSNIRGYIWVIPRKHQTSLGIGSFDKSCFPRLKKELDLFITKYYPYLEKIDTWGAFIPNVKDPQTFSIPLAGSNWILIGDAAGHVDPVTGEGIFYALFDAQLAAQAVCKNSPQLFDRFWRKEFGKKLSIRTKTRKWTYKKTFLELYCLSLRFRPKVYY